MVDLINSLEELKYSDVVVPPKYIRHFLPPNFSVSTKSDLVPYIEKLLDKPLNSYADLEQWLEDFSEMFSVVGEDFRRRLIKMTCDTENKEAVDSYVNFVENIQPYLVKTGHSLDEKLMNCTFLSDLDQEKYFVYLRSVRKSLALYVEKNIELSTESQVKEKKYGQLTGAMMVELDGEELTMQQARRKLMSQDRELREKVYRKLVERRAKDQDVIDALFDELFTLRHQMAVNANFTNYRDYKFDVLGRFDYKPEHCLEFHDAIAKEIVPLVKQIDQRRKSILKLDKLRPWDNEVDLSGQEALTPFANTQELIDKTIACLRKVSPDFGEYLAIMHVMGHLDLDSRKGKSPGGYNCTLPETGVPFIFMNAVGSVQDVITMVHEGGHAIHSFLTRDLEFCAFKNFPSEIAELASMAMELMSMEHWSVFFTNEQDLLRAKIKQLERVLSGLPWIAVVDKFQHWMYTHPEHTPKERSEEWVKITEHFSTKEFDYEGLEKYQGYSWHRQLHIFEVPFYYIEYAIAQLGAVAVWKQYKEEPTKTLDNYIAALKLGYTKTIGEVYAAAGINFDFSADYVKELGHFVMEELQSLYTQYDLILLDKKTDETS